MGLRGDRRPGAGDRLDEPPLARQRMDFLLLMPNQIRVVIECGGAQHYADDEVLANPRRSA